MKALFYFCCLNLLAFALCLGNEADNENANPNEKVLEDVAEDNVKEPTTTTTRRNTCNHRATSQPKSDYVDDTDYIGDFPYRDQPLCYPNYRQFYGFRRNQQKDLQDYHQQPGSLHHQHGFNDFYRTAEMDADNKNANTPKNIQETLTEHTAEVPNRRNFRTYKKTSKPRFNGFQIARVRDFPDYYYPQRYIPTYAYQQRNIPLYQYQQPRFNDGYNYENSDLPSKSMDYDFLYPDEENNYADGYNLPPLLRNYRNF